MRHVYGPVASRRLGLSLGIDLLPRKVCPFDCGYCQVGPTTCSSLEREDFVPLEQVLGEVSEALRKGPTPEVITLAGSGEPCLYRSLGPLLRGLRALTRIPLALVTNSALLTDPEVAAAALEADIFVPSLDAGDPRHFRVVNAPHPALRFEAIAEAIGEVTARHRGSVRIEVMLVDGQNDSDEALDSLTPWLRSYAAEVIEINTPIRPMPARGIRPCAPERLAAALARFGPRARIIGGYRGRAAAQVEGALEDRVLATLGPRPSTAADLSLALGASPDAVDGTLATLVARRKLLVRMQGQTAYYSLA
jgi:wyosine [tRNA(Phe)-imidazoG37] synthetase (radical SAM superfamily)